MTELTDGAVKAKLQQIRQLTGDRQRALDSASHARDLRTGVAADLHDAGVPWLRISDAAGLTRQAMMKAVDALKVDAAS